MTYTPGNNTKLYLPLNATDTYNDKSGRGTAMTNNQVTFEDVGGISAAYIGGALNYITTSSSISRSTFTSLCWVNITNISNTNYYFSFGTGGGIISSGSDKFEIMHYSKSSGTVYSYINATIPLGKWILLAYVRDGGVGKAFAFIEGTKYSVTKNLGDTSTYSWTTSIGNKNQGTAGSFYASQYIEESIAWTEEEVTSYFNSTKGDYGYFVPDYLHWDTQGPCPDGYHIPTADEWKAVLNMGDILPWNSSMGTQFSTYLKLPLPRYIDYNGSKYSGTEGRYWTATPSSTINNRSCALRLLSNSIEVLENNYRSCGFSIRPFKNIPIIPDSTWTAIYQLTGSIGVFHSPSLGLISLSNNGKKWITIADKNLGATTVRSGSTHTEANVGKYYQWGNNYGFPYSGTFATSSTKVDASGYGPGKYYNNSTFIKTSASPYDWSSAQNDNLWGGVTDRRVPVFEGDELCFSANTEGSTVQLTKNGSPTSVSLEVSTDKQTWTDYTIGNTITLTNKGDKIYIRNKSETATEFSTSSSNYYSFVMTGSISASGDITYLLCKNGTNKIPGYGLNRLFRNCASLTTPPSLPATSISMYCYSAMFINCTSLITLPELPAINLYDASYQNMFYGCSKIKVSSTKTGEYQIEYRIPTEGNSSYSGSNNPVYNIFANTGGTFTGTPSMNITYYIVDPRPAFSYTGIFWYDETDTEYENPLKPSQTITTPIAGYPDITETIGSYLNRVSSGWDSISGYNFSKISILNHDGDVIKEVDVNYIPTLDDFDDDGGKNSLSILISFKKKKAIRKVKKIINNGNTYKAGVQYPDGGEEGQVLMKTNTGTGWGTPEAGVPGIGIDNIVVCTESEYNSSTYENGIFYFVRED